MTIKTKLVVLLVMAVFFAGCSHQPAKKEVSVLPASVSSRLGYGEFEIFGDPNEDWDIYPKALEKVSKQTKGTLIKQTEGFYGFRSDENIYGLPPAYKLEQPLLGFFRLDGHEYWIVESGREYKSVTGKEVTSWIPVDENAPGVKYYLYKDGKIDKNVTEIFSQTLCWGIDGIEGMVNDITKVADDVAFKYIVGECTSTTSTAHAYIQGKSQNEVFRIDGSRYPFDYKGNPGFIANIGGREYIVVNGRVVSEGYTRIYTNSCCAMPVPAFELYDDGYLYFIGLKNEKAFVVETNVETFASELLLKTNVDPKTLKK